MDVDEEMKLFWDGYWFGPAQWGMLDMLLRQGNQLDSFESASAKWDVEEMHNCLVRAGIPPARTGLVIKACSREWFVRICRRYFLREIAFAVTLGVWTFAVYWALWL